MRNTAGPEIAVVTSPYRSLTSGQNVKWPGYKSHFGGPPHRAKVHVRPKKQIASLVSIHVDAEPTLRALVDLEVPFHAAKVVHSTALFGERIFIVFGGCYIVSSPLNPSKSEW